MKQPIRSIRLTSLFKEFFENEKVAGLILIVGTIISLLITNSLFGADYQHFWHSDFAGHPIEFWINDPLNGYFLFADWFGIRTGNLYW
jgi:NhaA family Na+:H+ antiporter